MFPTTPTFYIMLSRPFFCKHRRQNSLKLVKGLSRLIATATILQNINLPSLWRRLLVFCVRIRSYRNRKLNSLRAPHPQHSLQRVFITLTPCSSRPLKVASFSQTAHRANRWSFFKHKRHRHLWTKNITPCVWNAFYCADCAALHTR